MKIERRYDPFELFEPRMRVLDERTQEDLREPFREGFRAATEIEDMMNSLSYRIGGEYLWIAADTAKRWTRYAANLLHRKPR